MKSEELIEEVFLLEKPNGFEQVNINFIVEKYINNGADRRDVIKVFTQQGFSIFNKDKSEVSKSVVGFDTIFCVYYSDLSVSDLAYKVLIEIQLNNDKVTNIKGLYLRHMY